MQPKVAYRCYGASGEGNRVNRQAINREMAPSAGDFGGEAAATALNPRGCQTHRCAYPIWPRLPVILVDAMKNMVTAAGAR
jgi:hypothetical protein